MRLDLLEMAYRLVALLITMSFHEYAHARVADRLGDPTPRYSGRLTLNPLAHIDPIGMLMLWFFRFGWAKAVQVNVLRLRDRRKGLMMVAAAGPLTNLLLAFVTLFLLRVAFLAGLRDVGDFLNVLLWYNLLVAVFNLIPVPPLDGSKVLMGLLPGRQAFEFARLEQYGWILLFMLVWTGIVGRILEPVATAIFRTFHGIVWFILP